MKTSVFPDKNTQPGFNESTMVTGSLIHKRKHLPIRNLKAGSASDPRILILWKTGNVTP